MKISAIIIVKNEEAHIKEALESLSFADEIIVVDDSSTDKTVSIAKRFTSKIYNFKGEGYVEPLREFAISKTKHDWVFLLDADERVPDSLVQNLKTISEDVSAVLIPRKNIIFASWIQHAGWWPDYTVRFFRKDRVKWSDRIHSQPDVRGEKVQLNPTEENALVHYNYTTITQFIEKMNRYTTFQAQTLIDEQYTFVWRDLIIKPNNEFLSRFFAQEGFKEGLHGLVLSCLMSFYILVVYLKVWEQEGFKKVEDKSFLSNVFETSKTTQKDSVYWFLTTLHSVTVNPLQKAKYRLLKKVNGG